MPDKESIFSHALTFLGSSTVTALIQWLVNRRKNRVDVDQLMTKNMRDIDDFYQSILDKREDMADRIYQKLIEHETTIMTLKELNERLHQENTILKRTQQNGSKHEHPTQ